MTSAASNPVGASNEKDKENNVIAEVQSECSSSKDDVVIIPLDDEDGEIEKLLGGIVDLEENFEKRSKIADPSIQHNQVYNEKDTY